MTPSTGLPACVMPARRADATLRILSTRDLVVAMISQGLLNIAEEWATRHRFQLKLASFNDLVVPLSMLTVIQTLTLIGPRPFARRQVVTKHSSA